MKRIFLVCLVVTSCENKTLIAVKDNSPEKNKVDTLKVDENLLSSEDKQYIRSIDSITSIIDSKSNFVRSINTKVIQNNLETEIHYDGFSEEEDGVVNKIVASGKNQKQDLVYRYYYLNKHLIKVASDVKDYPPFYSAMYFEGNRVFKPKQLSLQSAEAVKAQSILLLNYFR